LSFLGVAGFVVISWMLAPQAFANYSVLDWFVRIGSIAAVLLFLYPVRNQIMDWLGGKPMPWLSALGLLGGGLGMAMVATFLLAPQLGVLGYWDFSDFPSHVWSQIIAIGIIVLSLLWYIFSKNMQKAKGINVDYAFKEIPPE
jgi:hypothetical protein